MNKEERLAALEKQALEILAEIEKIKAGKEDEVLEMLPMSDEAVYFVSTVGEVDSVVCSRPSSLYERHRVFMTRPMAELFRDKTQLIADLLHFKQLYDADYVPDWEEECIANYKLVLIV